VRRRRRRRRRIRRRITQILAGELHERGSDSEMGGLT
jgi:hypothetical protein